MVTERVSLCQSVWSDRNCLPWATAHLTPRFRVVHAAGFVITSVATLTGDCTLNSKRGTVIPLFELQIVLTWKGTAANGEHASGQISIPDFSHDSDLEELEAQQKALAREIRDSLILKVKEILSTFTADLIRENSKESRFIKPSSNATPPPTRANQPQPTQPAGRPRPLKAPQPVATANWTSPAADSSSSTQPRTTGFGLETQLVGTASDAYDTFLNPARIRVWSRDARVEMDSRPGMEYALFGANITGRICELQDRLHMAPPFLAGDIAIQSGRDHDDGAGRGHASAAEAHGRACGRSTQH
ncbi:activator of Hsp90 ATPase [Chytriomyces sp. MP71]|nr:activator of Hsp90 ATPase [Chytriomyces sp. MP71]